MEYLVSGVIAAINVAILIILVRQRKYFERKGENQAIKEDVGEITEIVESIKQELNNQGELIKAQLSHKSMHDLELKNEERQAYFDFNKKVSAWLYAIVRFGFAGYSFENFEELKLKYSEFTNLQYNYDIADGHLNLFNQDKNFHEKKLALVKVILALEHNLENHIREMYYSYSMANLIIESNPGDFKLHSAERDKARKTHSKLATECHDKFMPLYKDAINKQMELIDLINEQLKRIESL